MPVDPSILEDKIRVTIEKGEILIVLGLKSKDHQHLPALSKKRVQLFNKMPTNLPRNTGLVIHTRFVNHPDLERAKRQTGKLYPPILGSGQIKETLWKLASLLSEPPSVRISATPTPVEEVPAMSSPMSPPVAPLPPEVSQESNPQKTGVTPSPAVVPEASLSWEEREKCFCVAFRELANRNRPTFQVGGRTTTNLIRQHFGTERVRNDLYQLIQNEVIIPTKLPGKTKAGWYIAGSRMEKVLQEAETLSANSYEQARRYISQVPTLQAQKRAVEGELEELRELTRVATEKLVEINQKLERAEKATDLLAQLNSLLGTS